MEYYKIASFPDKVVDKNTIRIELNEYLSNNKDIDIKLNGNTICLYVNRNTITPFIELLKKHIGKIIYEEHIISEIGEVVGSLILIVITENEQYEYKYIPRGKDYMYDPWDNIRKEVILNRILNNNPLLVIGNNKLIVSEEFKGISKFNGLMFKKLVVNNTIA